MNHQNQIVAIILGSWLFANFVLVPFIGYIHKQAKKKTRKKLPRVPKGWQVYHTQSKAV